MYARSLNQYNQYIKGGKVNYLLRKIQVFERNDKSDKCQ